MRKIIPFAIMALSVMSCSKEETEQPAMNETVKEIWTTLYGTYKGTYISSLTGKEQYSETIEFHPYPEPKEITPVVILFPCFTAYGTAIITDTRFEFISGSSNYYYSINITYGEPTISFFECDDDGDVINREDKRIIKDWGISQFKMWNYGIAEEGNSAIHIKEK